MDINLLALNVGNTRLGVGVFVGGELEYVARLDNAHQADWAGKLADAWARIKDKPNPAVAGASVNPANADVLSPIIKDVTGQPIDWVGQSIDLPISVRTEPPGETGVDRVLNVAAAFEQMQKACVVVDAGTAITVDLCNDKGEFLGGAIAPGVNMQLDALHEKTARLPRVDFASPERPIGQSTQQAILHGVYHGIRGLVKELAENYATELGFWPDIIATGGDAQALFEEWELIHAIAPDLTFYGVALAYTEHHIKHET